MSAGSKEAVVRAYLVRIVASIMVVALPSSMIMADVASAMLNATGTVTVNGSPVSRSTAVFPGDRIQTAGNGFATLTAEGTSVLMSGNSSLVLYEQQVDLGCGGAVINTMKGMSARAGNLVITPSAPNAKFEIKQINGKLQVLAREGSVVVNNRGAMTAVAAGNLFSAPAAACMSPAAAQDAPPPGGATTGDTILFLLAAGAVTGTILYFVLRDTSEVVP